MKIENEELFKAWIAKDVEPLTDAEAEALAKYVLALVKKPLSDKELEEICLDKLNVFLQNHTQGFVDRMFQCLHEREYLPDSSRQKVVKDFEEFVHLSDEETETTEKSATLRSTITVKPNLESAKEITAKEAASKPVRRRISPPALTNTANVSTTVSTVQANDLKDSGRYNRQKSPTIRTDRSPIRSNQRRNISSVGNSNHTSSRGNRSDRYYRRRGSRSRSKSRSRSPYRKEKREDREESSRRHRCRDFHEKGVCMRGEKCVYDHGPDPVVIENSALEKIVSRGATNTTNTYNSINPPPPGIDKGGFGASINEAYNPEAPAITNAQKIDFSVPPPSLYPGIGNPVGIYGANDASTLVTVVPSSNNYNSNLVSVPQRDSGVYVSYAPNVSSHMSQHGVGAAQSTIAGFGRRGYRGQRFKPYGAGNRVDPTLCSLVVIKIPPEQNKIVLLDQHFGKFGQITNIHVQYEQKPDTALVTFKTRREALNAFKSTEPIFNNRFIKVFWQTQAHEATDNGNESTAPTGGVAATTLSNNLENSLPNSNEVQAPPAVPIANRVFSKVFNNTTAAIKDVSLNDKPIDNTQLDKETVNPVVPLAHSEKNLTVYKNPIEVIAKRKADKDALQRLLELHRLKMDIYNKQIEQQTGLLKKVQATVDKDIRRKFMILVKKTEESTKATRTEIEDLAKQIAVRQEASKQSQNKKWVKKDLCGIVDKANDSLLIKNKNSTESDVSKAADTLKKQTPIAVNKKKLYRVVAVYGCPVEAHSDLIVYMEKFGELFDYDITSRNVDSPCQFTYRHMNEAQNAIAKGGDGFAQASLKIEWSPSALGTDTAIVPDLKRKPDERITPAALLASIDFDEEEEEEAN